MDDHPRANDQEEQQADRGAVDDAGGLQLVDGVGGCVQRRPAARDEPAPVESIGDPPFQQDPAGDEE
jgi:hypothetical protein